MTLLGAPTTTPMLSVSALLMLVCSLIQLTLARPQSDVRTGDDDHLFPSQPRLLPSTDHASDDLAEENTMRSGLHKRFTFISHGRSSSDTQCLTTTLSTCDMKSLVLSTEGGNPCSLLQLFEQCIDDRTESCNDRDILLLKESLDYLKRGFQNNGQCRQFSSSFIAPVSSQGSTERCNPHGTWSCAANLVTDLTVESSTCGALATLRDCLGEKTQQCGYVSSRYFINGIGGLIWGYQKASPNTCPTASRSNSPL